MKSLTHCNHLKFGYGPQFADYSPDETFYIGFGPLSREPDLPFEEAQKCAQTIDQEHNQLRLCLSGGLDGEAMALAFLEQKIPFEVRILRFKDGWNDFDIFHATKFCKDSGISYQFIDLDIINFYESGEFKTWAERYRTGSPELAAHCWFLDQVDGTPVIGGDMVRSQIVAGESQLIVANDHNLCFFRYFQKEQREGIPSFHYYTPEFAWSFMAHLKPMPEIYAIEPNDRSEEFYLEKLQRYLRGGFPIPPNTERRSKYHGFEKLKDHYDQDEIDYKERFRKPVLFREFLPQKKAFLIEREDVLALEIFSSSLPQPYIVT